MKKYAVVVAGGSGTRMQSVVPKQFLLLKDKPVLLHTLTRFYEADPSIQLILVLPEMHKSRWEEICQHYQFTVKHTVISGGPTRFHSVKSGLSVIQENGLVAVHDAVRPLISKGFINRLFDEAEKKGNAIPVLPVQETMRLIQAGRSESVDRSLYRIVQTPQIFYVDKIKKACSQDYQDSFTDEATVMEMSGEQIFLVEGERFNIKITTPEDLTAAEKLMA